MFFIGSQASPGKEGVHVSLCNFSLECHLCSRLQYTDGPGLCCGAAEESSFQSWALSSFPVWCSWWVLFCSSVIRVPNADFQRFLFRILIVSSKIRLGFGEFHTVGEAGGSEHQGHFRVSWEEFPSLDEWMIPRKKEGAWWGTLGRKGKRREI